MISAVHTQPRPSVGLLPDLVRVVRRHLRTRTSRVADPEPVRESDDALVRALCHDMHGSLSCLESALRQLSEGVTRADLLELARSQAAHLSSMLRTAEATGGAPARRATAGRSLRDVVTASIAASGLPRRQLTVQMGHAAADVHVADARLQRILLNLLENAHRHGRGEPVLLCVAELAGWVRMSLRQAGVPTDRVVGHLSRADPPAELTGLGLWSVRRQTRELGGRLSWEDDGAALTIVIELPDR